MGTLEEAITAGVNQAEADGRLVFVAIGVACIGLLACMSGEDRLSCSGRDRVVRTAFSEGQWWDPNAVPVR